MLVQFKIKLVFCIACFFFYKSSAIDIFYKKTVGLFTLVEVVFTLSRDDSQQNRKENIGRSFINYLFDECFLHSEHLYEKKKNS